MAVEVRWLIKPRVLMHQFSGEIRLEDATYASVAGPELVAEGTPPVHMIVHLLEVTHYPRSVVQLQAAIRNNPRLTDVGWLVVVIRQNPLLSFTAAILTRVRFANLRVLMAEDMAGALRHLRELDPSLEPLISPDGQAL